MDEIEEIKQKIDIVEFINQHVPLKRMGASFKAICPFHSEKTPSFIVSPERQIWHCFGACLPPGSLIKTSRGYHPIEEIQIGELVLTHKGRYMPVTQTWWRPYKGEIVNVRVRKSTNSVSLTSSHKVYVVKTKNCKQRLRRTRICQSRCRQNCPSKFFLNYRIEKIPAEEISLNDYLLLPIDEKVKKVELINLKDYLTRKISDYARRLKRFPTLLKVNEDSLRLIGYWIAEGSTDESGHVIFSLGNQERDFAREIEKLVWKVFGLRAVLRKKTIEKNRSSGMEVIINSLNLANIFENLCGKGAANKHIPFVLKNLPKEKQRIFLEAIFKGDGHLGKVAGTKKRRYFKAITTTSLALVEQLRDILLRVGIIPTITSHPKRIDKNGVSHQRWYVLSWQEDIKLHFADVCKTNNVSYAFLPVKEIKKRIFKGLVYNLAVSKDHSYTTFNFVVKNCNEGGDIFTFLMKWENIEFYEALKILAKKAGVKLEKLKIQSPKFKAKEKIYEINHLTSEFYHFLLTSHQVGKKALDYLTFRGITKRSVDTFSLGYAPASWRSALPFLKKKGYAEEEIEKAGLVIGHQGAGYYDRFRGRVIFPLKDHRGNIVGFSGRVLEPEVKEAKYINTPETLVYHKGDLLYGLDLAKKAIREKDDVIITEGEFDVISSFQAGIENIVAIKGSALTQGHVRLLKRFTENATLALDSDLAGDAAARRGIEIADQEGLFVNVIELPKGSDPDSLIQKGVDLWLERIKARIPVYDFFLRSALARLKGEKPQEKRKIAKELLPIWVKITDPIVQAHYIKVLAQKLKVSEESIVSALSKLERKEEPKREEMLLSPREKSREEILEEYFLALLLKLEEIDQFLESFFEEKAEEYFETLAIKKIIKQLKAFFKKTPKFNISLFAKDLPKELIPALDKAYLTNIEENFQKEEDKIKEIEKIIREIKKLFLRRKIKILATKIKEKGIRQEFRTLISRLRQLEKGD